MIPYFLDSISYKICIISIKIGLLGLKSPDVIAINTFFNLNVELYDWLLHNTNHTVDTVILQCFCIAYCQLVFPVPHITSTSL